MKIPQKNRELWQHLRDAIFFLESSCDSYDKGFEAESKRLSSTLRLLLHSTKNSTSLLDQLELGDTTFLDTALARDRNNLELDALLVMRRMKAGVGSQYIPRVWAPPRPGIEPQKISFERWWEQIVLAKTNHFEFSRQELILHQADTDGGAHVDPSLDEKYANVSRDKTAIFEFVTGNKILPELNKPVFASIRQIAYEVIESIRPELQ